MQLNPAVAKAHALNEGPSRRQLNQPSLKHVWPRLLEIFVMTPLFLNPRLNGLLLLSTRCHYVASCCRATYGPEARASPAETLLEGV